MVCGKFFLILFLASFLFQDIYPYIDPGTGSYLLQLLIAVLAGSLYFVKVFWTQIKNFSSKSCKSIKRILKRKV